MDAILAVVFLRLRDVTKQNGHTKRGDFEGEFEGDCEQGEIVVTFIKSKKGLGEYESIYIYI